MNPKVRSLIPLMEEVVNLDKTRVEPVNAVEVVKPVEVVVKPVDVPKVVPVLTPKIETPPQIPLVEITKPIESKPRVFTWVAGGLALVGAGTGAAFGLMAQDTTGKIKNPTGEGNYENLSKQLSDQSTVANVSFVTAGVAAAAAVVLFFVEGN